MLRTLAPIQKANEIYYGLLYGKEEEEDASFVRINLLFERVCVCLIQALGRDWEEEGRQKVKTKVDMQSNNPQQPSSNNNHEYIFFILSSSNCWNVFLHHENDAPIPTCIHSLCKLHFPLRESQAKNTLFYARPSHRLLMCIFRDHC
jgi:hypothetical protein